MIPTLFIGDHIFVNKFAYGLKVPFSDLLLDEAIQIIKRDPPKRGDIIVFVYPKDESFFYIKRVIGTPGDTVEIKDKVLYINDQPMNRVPLPADQAQKIFGSLDDPRYSKNNLELYRENLNPVEHTIMLDKNNFLGESFEKVTIPPGQFFVMGDNRDFSNDSRFWGFVPLKNVRGKAMVIWLSLWINPEEPSKTAFNPSRIGTILR